MKKRAWISRLFLCPRRGLTRNGSASIHVLNDSTG
jgi:hypothetical protein